MPRSKDPEGHAKEVAYHRRWRSQHRARYNEHIRKHNAKLRLLVFGHYSPFLMCVRCGCSDMRVLCIDHIEGGGNAHRRAILKRRGGIPFYRWLKQNGYPSGFQVLCLNCNWIKAVERGERGHV